MAARTRKIQHDEETRAKIKASQLINRLTEHVLGTVEMVPSQVTAALGLLRKVVPDLSAVELSGETVTRFVAEIPAQSATTDKWQQQHVPPQFIQ